MANILSQNWLLSRRHLLRGLGVSLALPLLDCMRPLLAADKAVRPKRSVFIYLPNGVNTHEYQMATAGKDYQMSKPLQALAKHRDIITPFSGMYHPHGLGHHHNCSTIWLTGGKIGQSERNTISVDQLMATVTAPQTRFSSIELSNQGHSLSYNADGIQLPHREALALSSGNCSKNPRVVWRISGADCSNAAAFWMLSLTRPRPSIANWDQRIRADWSNISHPFAKSKFVPSRADKWLDVPRPTVDPGMASQLNRDVALERLGEYLRTMYDILVLAFQTDLTRVATFCTGNEGTGPAVPEIGVKQDRHSLSHHNGNPKLLADLMSSDTFNLQQFGYFLDRLREVKDADGPLIETTMALYGSGMAYGHSHGNASLPIVLAGGTAARIEAWPARRLQPDQELSGLRPTPRHLPQCRQQQGSPQQSIADDGAEDGCAHREIRGQQ